MALSAFEDKNSPPTPAALRRALGAAAETWKALVAHVAETCGPIEEAWNHAGAKYGWSLRLRRGGANLVYLTPQSGGFLFGMALGEKAVRAAHEAKLPATVLAILKEAPRYAEGRGVRVRVDADFEASVLRHLVALKARTATVPPARKSGNKPPKM